MPLTFVYQTEASQFGIVLGIGIVQQTMFQRNGRMSSSKVDDAECLAVGNVTATVGIGFHDREVVELGIASLLAFTVETEQGMARALKGDELIRQRHLAP